MVGRLPKGPKGNPGHLPSMKKVCWAPTIQTGAALRMCVNSDVVPVPPSQVPFQTYWNTGLQRKPQNNFFSPISGELENREISLFGSPEGYETEPSGTCETEKQRK